MILRQAFLTRNPCYQNNLNHIDSRYATFQQRGPLGLMLHSIGCPQPSANVLINSWNRESFTDACVHGFIDANDGTAFQTLPWNFRGWHGGSPANDTHIGVEMCEPACIRYTGGSNFVCSDYATARAAATRTYNTAVELFARLCKQFGLDPLADGVILSHREGHARGIATYHGDPEHLWRGLGMSYTMDGFRRDVAAALAAKNTVEEDNDMIRYHSIGEMPSYYREEAAQLVDSGALQGDNGDLNVSEDMIRGAIIGMRYAKARNPRYYSIDDVPSWAREETQRMIDRGVLQGDGKHELNVTYDALQAMIVCQRMIDNAKEGKA